MTYDPNIRYTNGAAGQPFSGGITGGSLAPPAGSYVRLAPSADALRDVTQRDLLPGDLILSTTADADGAAIRRVTDSPVSHVAIYIGDGQVIEAIAEGVTIQPLSTALADDYYAAAYRRDGLTAADRDALVRWLRTQEGRPYGLGGQVSDDTNGDDAWFCSELTFRAFMTIGKPLTSVPPDDSEPGHVLTMDTVSYLGHLKRPGAAAAQGFGVYEFPDPGPAYAMPRSGGMPDAGRRAFAPSEADRDRMITPGQYGQSIGLSALRPGDIILTSGNAAISEAIRTRTGAPVSHAALYVGDGQIVEMVGNGAQKVALSSALGEADYAAAYRVPGLTPAQEAQLVAFAEDVVRRGVQFDFWAIATFPHGNTADQLYCSEMVLEAFRAAGRDFGGRDTLVPGDVITLPGIQYLGHIPAQADNASARSQAYQMSAATGIDAAIRASVAAGASHAQAQAYFGGAGVRSLSDRTITLPDITFVSASSPLMAGISELVARAFPAALPGGRSPIDHLFDYCTRNNCVLAIGIHAGMPIPQIPVINVGGSVGIAIAPHRRAGVYASGNIGAGWNLEVAAGIEVVMVSGGESAFNGVSVVLGGSVDASEGPGAGFRVIMNTSGQPIGVIGELNFSIGVPTASAVEFTLALSFTESYMVNFSVMPMNALPPQLAAAIRAAVADGATEEEARAFLIGRAQSYPMHRGYPLSGESLPAYTPLSGWQKIAVCVALDITLMRFGLSSSRFAQAARRGDVSIGLGAGVTVGLGGSAGGGVGVVFLPNGDMAMYGALALGGGWNFEISASYDLTVINGDASAFFGQSLVVGGSVSFDAGISIGGGARAVMPPGGGDPIGIIIQGTVGLGLPLISTFEGGLQEVTTIPFSAAQSPGPATLMIGGLPVYPAARGMQARPRGNVIPFAHRPAARAAATTRSRIWM
jgi:cell wall-associated NlpC family hydrolase